MRVRLALTAGLVFGLSPLAADAQTTYYGGYRSDCKPQVYKSVATGNIFYVESDGQHLVAISPDGKILWRNTPHDGLDNYHFAPCIHYVGETDMGRGRPGRYIGLQFSNSQAGI